MGLAPTSRADVAIVNIDDQSLAQIGPWPWSRGRQAELLEALSRLEPKAVVYQVLLTESGPNAQDDQRLAAAIGFAGPVYLAAYVTPTGLSRVRLVEPLPVFKRAAAGVGTVNVEQDPDGVVRRFPHTPPVLTQARPMADILADASGAPATRRSAESLVPFSLNQDEVLHVSAASILGGRVKPSALKDKTVFLAVTATGVGERFMIPRGRSKVTAPELQAQFYAAALSGRAIQAASPFGRLGFDLAVLWTLLGLLAWLGPRMALTAGAAFAAAVIGASGLILLTLDVWLPPSAALASVALVLPLWGWRRLSATSDFLKAELQALRQTSTEPPRRRSLDLVLDQAGELEREISRIDELRRFANNALAHLPQAMVVVDNDGKVIAANDAAAALFKQGDSAALAGAALAQLLSRVGVSPAALSDDWPGTAPTAPVEIVLADDRIFQLQAAAYRDPAPNHPRWILQLVDVTDLQLALRQREEAVRFLTHDIKAPITSLCSLLDQEPAGGIRDGLRDRLKAHAKRALALADGFVHIARAEVLSYVPEPVDLCEVVTNAVEELWPQSQAHGVVLQTLGLKDGAWVDGDGALLFRAVLNLCGNAVKFSPTGGVVSVTVGDADQDGRLVVEVANQGPGLLESELPGLFDTFVARPQAMRFNAAGLGLAFVKVVAQRHGGEAFCRRWADGDVAFTLELPASIAPADLDLRALLSSKAESRP